MLLLYLVLFIPLSQSIFSHSVIFLPIEGIPLIFLAMQVGWMSSFSFGISENASISCSFLKDIYAE